MSTLPLIHGRTALHLAVAAGNRGVIDLLLRSGADPGQRDNCGSSAVDIARLHGHASAMEALSIAISHRGDSSSRQRVSNTSELLDGFLGSPLTNSQRQSFETQLRAEAKKDLYAFHLAIVDARNELIEHAWLQLQR